jgi:hypothetical protein
MSSFPAATFTQFDPATQPRHALRSGWGSPLYMIHKDITQTLENPNSINEIIDGSETEAQYSVVLSVPPGSRYMVPYHVVSLNITSSPAASAWFTRLPLTITHASATFLRYYFLGQIPTVASTYAYGPVEAAMTSAVAESTYGYWQTLGSYRLTASSGGATNHAFFDPSEGANAVPGFMGLPLASASGTTRTIVLPMVSNFGNAQYGETLFNYGSPLPNTTAASAGIYTQPVEPDGYIPTFGCSRVTCYGTFGSTAGTIARAVTMSVGTATIGSWGIGVRFFA